MPLERLTQTKQPNLLVKHEIFAEMTDSHR